MRETAFDEVEVFRPSVPAARAPCSSGAARWSCSGLPLLTADYDFWLAADDISGFNHACATFDLHPSKSPEQARRTGRYVLENDEHVAVLVARAVTARTGEVVEFDDLWTRRNETELTPGVTVSLPHIDDLILTKRFALRPKDLEDIRLLEILKGEGAP